MNRKIILITIMIVFMLIVISFTSSVISDNSKPVKKESPLFGIRTRQAIREKIGNFMRRFIGKRVFFLPFQWIININDPHEGNPLIKGPYSFIGWCDFTDYPKCTSPSKYLTCSEQCP